jgi:hypothetical protein
MLKRSQKLNLNKKWNDIGVNKERNIVLKKKKKEDINYLDLDPIPLRRKSKSTENIL